MTVTAETRQPYAGPNRAGIAMVMAILLVLAILASLMVGASGLPLDRSLRALFVWDGSADHALVFDVRLPRALLAALVGANLAIAGVLIQTLTRNPLASPQTFGINAGAALAIVIVLIAVPGAGRLGQCLAGLCRRRRRRLRHVGAVAFGRHQHDEAGAGRHLHPAGAGGAGSGGPDRQ